MSLRWPERLEVVLSPAAATCARARRWPWRGAPVTVRRPVTPAAGASSTAASESGLPAVQALASWLEEASAAGLPARTPVHVALSNHFVRFLVVPWRDGVPGRAEREALARHAFHERYGDAADAWAVRLGTAAYGRAALACATDRSLIEALRSACAARRLVLASAQPLLTVALDAHARHLTPDAALFVVEPGRAVALGLQAGACHAVHSLRLGMQPWSEALRKRQADLMGLSPEQPVHVVHAEGPAAAPTDKPVDGEPGHLLNDARASAAPTALGQARTPRRAPGGAAARLWTLAAGAAA